MHAHMQEQLAPMVVGDAQRAHAESSRSCEAPHSAAQEGPPSDSSDEEPDAEVACIVMALYNYGLIFNHRERHPLCSV